MSEAAYVLLGVLAGTVATPIIQGIGFIIRRWLGRGDERKERRRQDLRELQDALVDLTEAIRSTAQIHGPESLEEIRERKVRVPVAYRRLRVCAAKVGGARLWELVNRPPADGLVFVASRPSTSPFVPRDELDEVNDRVRELLAEL